MKNLKDVNVTEVKVGYAHYTWDEQHTIKIWHNCDITTHAVETDMDYPWYPRYKNVSKKKEWSYWEMGDVSPESWCMTLHDNTGKAVTITTPNGGPKQSYVTITGEDGDICELFQFYNSNTGRTIGIGVNIAPGWYSVDIGYPLNENSGIMKKYTEEGRIIFHDILGLGDTKEVTIKTLSGKELTYGMSELLEFRGRGADILVRYPSVTATWESGHLAYHDRPEAMWQIVNGHRFNLALFKGKWYHCSAINWEMDSYHTPDHTPPESVAFLRKLKLQPQYLGKIPNKFIKADFDEFMVDGEHIYSNGIIHGSIAWSNIPFERRIDSMETYLGKYGVKGVRSEYRFILTPRIYLVIAGEDSHYLVSTKKYYKGKHEVYHISPERDTYTEAVKSFVKRLDANTNTDIDALIKSLPSDFNLTYEMSRGSGNCHSGTMAFAKAIWNITNEKEVVTVPMITSHLDTIKAHRDVQLFINAVNRRNANVTTEVSFINTKLLKVAMCNEYMKPMIWVNCTEGVWHGIYTNELFEKIAEKIMKGVSGHNINIICSDENRTTQIRLLCYIPEFISEDREYVCSVLRCHNVVRIPAE